MSSRTFLLYRRKPLERSRYGSERIFRYRKFRIRLRMRRASRISGYEPRTKREAIRTSPSSRWYHIVRM